MTGNTTSFWNFIQNYNIEIPIIQRDYAQGRIGKEYLRKSFLTDIKQSLDDRKVLKLDFVYGSVEDGRLQPLDGQQRLTTLWLLHWYIALRAGKLADAYQILKGFTYETRTSSRDFCQNLCNAKNFDQYQEQKIVEFIKGRTWFYSSWEQDPTIKAMLTMLGGTERKDKNGEDIMDGIEELFQNTDKEVFERYWENLTSENASVVFYHLPLTDFGLSDDLYIKMNARGKQLTDFENFKADMIGYIRKEAEESEGKEEWCDLLRPESGIPVKMDTDWTDIFWKANKNGRVDEVYFAFLNRYLLHYAIAYSDVKEGDKAWKLYGEKSNDAAVSYDNGFDLYGTILKNPGSFKGLKRMFEFIFGKFLEVSVNESIIAHLPQWFATKDSFDFIPSYKEKDDDKISTLTQSQRVVFFGICRYFEQSSDFNEQTFKRWMRIVCNLTENTSIDTVDAMIARIKLIAELSEHIEDIYEFLADANTSITSKASTEQVFEEREKAKRILASHSMDLPEKPKDWDDSIEWNWEAAITEAENHAFFKGAIRFLFTNDKNKVDWSYFAEKLGNARLIFNDNGLTEKYQESALANRIILSYCSKWVEQIESYTHNDKYIFGFSAGIWRNNILLKLKKDSTDKSLLYANSIHHLLMGDAINESLNLEDTDDDRPTALNKLVNTNIIELAKKKKNTEKNYVRRYGGLSLYPSSEGVILTKDSRDQILNELQDRGIIRLNNRHQIEGLAGAYKMLFGWNIDFTYSKENTDYHFRWQYWDWIDMYKDGKRLCDDEAKKELTIDERKIKCPDDLIKEMDACIDRYEEIKRQK